MLQHLLPVPVRCQRKCPGACPAFTAAKMPRGCRTGQEEGCSMGAAPGEGGRKSPGGAEHPCCSPPQWQFPCSCLLPEKQGLLSSLAAGKAFRVHAQQPPVGLAEPHFTGLMLQLAGQGWELLLLARADSRGTPPVTSPALSSVSRPRALAWRLPHPLAPPGLQLCYEK